MAEKMTPQGLVVGLIPDECLDQETPKPEVKEEKQAPARGRKPKAKE